MNRLSSYLDEKCMNDKLLSMYQFVSAYHIPVLLTLNKNNQ